MVANAHVQILRLLPGAVLLEFRAVDVEVVCLGVGVDPAVVRAIASRAVGREKQDLAIGRQHWVSLVAFAVDRHARDKRVSRVVQLPLCKADFCQDFGRPFG